MSLNLVLVLLSVSVALNLHFLLSRNQCPSLEPVTKSSVTCALPGVNASTGHDDSVSRFEQQVQGRKKPRSIVSEMQQGRRNFWFGSSHKRWHNLQHIMTEKEFKKGTGLYDPNLLFVFLPPYIKDPNAFKFFQEGKHLVNHSPNDRAQFIKESLLLHFREYAEAHNCDYTEFHPLTFRLHQPDECVDLLEHEAALSPDVRSQQIWYTKVLDNYGGVGVNRTSLRDLKLRYFPEDVKADAVVSSPEEREEVCAFFSDKVSSEGGLLLQRAIDKAYLIEKKKFDMRVYMLIANHDPFYVFYHRGFIRRSLVDDDPNSINNSSFLTNTALQSKTKGYNIANHRWWMDDKLHKHILSEGFTETQYREIFDDQVKKLCQQVFLASKDYLVRKNGFFLVLGIDLILDTNMNAHVLEVNTNPRMTDDEENVGPEYVQRQVNMLREMISIVYEIHRTVWSDEPFDPLHWHSARDWQLIYTDDTEMYDTWQYSSDDACFRHEYKWKPGKTIPIPKKKGQASSSSE